VLAKPYVYDSHYMPHDVAIRELISGASRQSTLEGIGLKNIHVGVKCDPVERINASRILLPKCVFDKVACAKGLEALKGYRREWDEKQKVYKSRPCHDWASHSADAFGEYAINFRQKAEAMISRRRPNIGTRA
jgi:phage terminase large subunit